MATAVACAVTNMGSTLITDISSIDAENRAKIVEAGGSGLARGCLDAINLR